MRAFSSNKTTRVGLPALTGILLAAASGVCASEAVRNAHIETRDGQVLQGPLEWQVNALVLGSVPPRRVELTNLHRLSFVTPEAQPQAVASAQGTGLLGFYYPGTNFQGSPVIRLDSSLQFNWGWDTLPLPGFRHDLFSVRWTGRLQPPRTDVYTLFLGSDDGGRFWLDGAGPFALWSRHDFAETNYTVRLEAGRAYDLRVEYFDYFGNAQVELNWSSSAFPKTIVPRQYLYATSSVPEHASQIDPGPGLLACYHFGSQFGEPSFTRVESKIALDAVAYFSPDLRNAREAWAQARRRTGQSAFASTDGTLRSAEESFAKAAAEMSSPIVPGVAGTFFTVRWSGQVIPADSGVYSFRLVTDEGMRFWLNDELVSDRWDEIYPGEYKHAAKLTAGRAVNIRLETLNTDGHALAKLFWTPPDKAEAVLEGNGLLPSSKTIGAPVLPPEEVLQPGGILLSKGTFVPIQPETLDANALRLNGPVVRLSLPRPRVARVYFRPLPAEQQGRLKAGRPGALLENGDFIEGAVLDFQGSTARIDSVLFGRRSYHAPGPVVALVLGDGASTGSAYRLAVKGLGTVLASDIRLTQAGVSVPELTGHTFSSSEILEIARIGQP